MAEATVRSGGQHRQVHTESRIAIEVIVARIVYWVFGVIETLIALRFVMRVLGANAAAPFTAFIYRISAVFMAPFLAVFRTQDVQGAAFEWSALLALLIYALVAWGIVALMRAAGPRRAVSTVEESEHVDESQTDTRR